MNKYFVCYESEENDGFKNVRYKVSDKNESNKILNECKVKSLPCHIFNIGSDMTEEFLLDVVYEENEVLKNNIGNLLCNKKVCNIICGVLFISYAYMIWEICKLLGTTSYLLVLCGLVHLMIVVLKSHRRKENE